MPLPEIQAFFSGNTGGLMRNPVPRVAAVHDLSGFGRTSLTVAIPILSTMGIQVCPLPTAVLSTHTVEYTDYTLLDLTGELGGILDHWERLGLTFDGVYSGFMASPVQMESVARCIRSCLAQGGIAVVDPVLGDNGVLDPTMTPEMVEKMRWLITLADVITPNFTEVALLLGEPCRTEVDILTLQTWLRRLAVQGPRTVIATSVPLAGTRRDGGHENVCVVAYERDADRFWKTASSYIPAHYPGTGDIFASVLTGSLLQGESLSLALDRAVQFVTLGIRASFGQGFPTREGILLERILASLRVPLTVCSAEIMEKLPPSAAQPLLNA